MATEVEIKPGKTYTAEEMAAIVAENEQLRQQAKAKASEPNKLIGKLVFVAETSWYGDIGQLVSSDGKKAQVKIVCGPAREVGKTFPTSADAVKDCGEFFDKATMTKLVEAFGKLWHK